MADKHDETARELLKALEWYERGIGDAPPYELDVQAIASALRKAEADGLREAAGLVEEEFMRGISAHDIVQKLRARAAEKETND